MWDKMSFTARIGIISDLDTITSFTLAEAWDAEKRRLSPEIVRAGIKECLEDPSIATYWVLESPGDGLIGCASLIRERSDWLAGYYGWVQSMYILPKYRGRGLSGVLIASLRKQAKEEGLHDLRLYVHQDNSQAIKAYLKNGFSQAPYKILSLGLKSPV
jgi:GNAT superfamily N-acetyltransferase